MSSSLLETRVQLDQAQVQRAVVVEMRKVLVQRGERVDEISRRVKYYEKERVVLMFLLCVLVVLGMLVITRGVVVVGQG